MIRQLISALLALTAVAAAAYWYLGHDHIAEEQHDGHDSEHQGQDDHAMQEQPKGPNGGRLLSKNNFALEITIFESGVDPEFRVYAYQQQQPLDPSRVDVTIDLERIDGQIDHFDFKAKGDYLRGDGIVTEPHSFVVYVKAQYEGNSYVWQYDSIEGRTQIPADIAAEAGIKTAPAGPGVITEYLPVTGHLVQVPDRQSSVRAAYPGIVKSVSKRIGERVSKGDHLLTIQNSSSLQNYTVTAPISGVVVERNVQQGESTNGEVLFVIADLDQLWVELDIFSKDFNKVKTGQTIELETFSGQKITSTLEQIWPTVRTNSQSFRAIASVPNTPGEFFPGQRISGVIHIAEHEVAIAVPHAAIQSFRDLKVVFARFNDEYEVRMLELGRADNEHVEVLGGINPGTEYVIENSYLIKADIEKDGASHDH